MFNPTRGGNRGGRDQFSWDDVKKDQHRENYLGHSVMAPVGRWQNGKDLSWWNKSGAKDGPDAAASAARAKAEELARVKAAEEEVMMIALGLKKPDHAGDASGNVEKTKAELANVMAKLKRDDEETAASDAGAFALPDVDTGISGLGSSRSARLIPQDLANAPRQLPGTASAAAIPRAVLPLESAPGHIDAEWVERGASASDRKNEKKEKKSKSKSKHHKSKSVKQEHHRSRRHRSDDDEAK
ncbi:hypothetical protein H9P43_008244 [Blastocladiella emersonii ATCC 22665]|nr:hypothetical protein H9P43_008244 [Blastocladiella emersonii ATCC 22665]